jgi:hypothetical protein
MVVGCGDAGGDLDGEWKSEQLTEGHADTLTLGGDEGSALVYGRVEDGAFTRSGSVDDLPLLACPLRVSVGPEHSLAPGWHDLRFSAAVGADPACASFTDQTKCGVENDRLVCSDRSFHR